jgi:endonuclease-3
MSDRYERPDSLKKKAVVYRRLQKAHPDARIELKFKTPLELLVATLLSAQCTDVKVNEVTASLFKKYRKPEDYLRHPLSELEADIRPTGFFRQKAKSLRGAMEGMVDAFGGQVPDDMEGLTGLPGIGRKTANVILGNAFGVPAIVVDTHVARVSQRIGLTAQKNPEKIETALGELFPRKSWTQLSHLLIFHGRYICKARKPLCDRCSLTDVCDYFSQLRKP